MEKNIRILSFKGKSIQPFINDIARLRIEVFREYPYLYDGDIDYEKDYLSPFLSTIRAAAVLAFAGNEVVGASTCLPLSDESEEFQKPFLEKGLPVSEIFYFGESVLKKAYRGKGIGVAFFNEREAQAFSFPGIRKTVFCAVERPETHPLKPKDYQPLNDFWERRGYRILPGMFMQLDWKDIDQPQSTGKKMIFWEKVIRNH